MAESPTKKAKKATTYLMNINNAMDKAWEEKSLTEIAQAPISALQGLAEWTDAEFAKLGLSSISELGNWKFFLWARALCKLADTEIKDKRRDGCLLNVNNALDKEHEPKHLCDVLKQPPSALQGLAPWVDEVLAKLHVKTIAQLGNWKYAEWANSIALLTDREQDIRTLVPAKPPASRATKKAAAPVKDPAPAAEPAAEAAAAAAETEAAPGAGADPDAAANAWASDNGIDDVVVTEHYKLAQVDIEKNIDKYMVLQTCKVGEQFLFVERWGRTGTRGQAKVEGPYDTAEEAASLLSAKFEEKTGNSLDSFAAGTFEKKSGRYDVFKDAGIAPRSLTGKEGGCLWQYYVDDGVDGKRVGWHDYTKEAAEMVEVAYTDFVNNPDRNCNIRSVQSGYFCYHVNFNEMQQTNVTHKDRRQRKIRRNA